MRPRVCCRLYDLARDPDELRSQRWRPVMHAAAETGSQHSWDHNPRGL